jgi:hypothetical protein
VTVTASLSTEGAEAVCLALQSEHLAVGAENDPPLRADNPALQLGLAESDVGPHAERDDQFVHTPHQLLAGVRELCHRTLGLDRPVAVHEAGQKITTLALGSPEIHGRNVFVLE